MTKDHVDKLHVSESLLPQCCCDCFLNLLVHNALGVARRKAVGLQVPLDLIGESIEDHLQEVELVQLLSLVTQHKLAEENFVNDIMHLHLTHTRTRTHQFSNRHEWTVFWSVVL